MRRARSAAALVAVMALLLVVSPGRAQDAQALYDEAKAAIDDERYEEAAASFERGYVAASEGPMRWRMALGLALSHELGGDSATAAGFYQLFLDLSADHPEAEQGVWAERRVRAERDVDAILERLAESHARLRLDTVPAGATVIVDGEPMALRPTPATFVLRAGEHRIELALDGHQPIQTMVTLEPNERAHLQRALPEVLPEEPPAKAAVVPPAPPAPVAVTRPPTAQSPNDAGDGMSSLRVAGVVSLGVGGASLIAAAVVTGLTAGVVGEMRELREVPVTPATVSRDGELRDDLSWMQPTYAVLYTVAGVAAAAGLVMVLWPADEPDAMSIGLAPFPAGAALVGRF